MEQQLSRYRIQIVDADTGEVVFFALPGMAVERKLIKEVAERAVSKGIGFWVTEEQAKTAIVEAFQELLREMKKDVPAK